MRTARKMLWLFCVVLATRWCAVSGSPYDICETSDLAVGGVGAEGEIRSPYYPQPMVQSKTCRIILSACDQCRITLNFTQLQLPNCTAHDWSWGNCVYGCYHLYVHEPDYTSQTIHYYFAADEGVSYTSISNRLFLVLCVADRHYDNVKFNVQYQITEKFQEFTGTSDDTTNPSGYIRSPNFPGGYAMRNEVYTYRIHNTHPNGVIRLGFDDWSLSPNSRISIYFHNDTHPEGFLTRTGKQERPFVTSYGPYLYIKFETGQDVYNMPYVGFKAFFHFVTTPRWPDKPYTVCGEYYHSLLGGHFSFDGRPCWPGDRLDCIWVIIKYEDTCCDYSQAVGLAIPQLHIQDGDRLEVRAGNSSEAPLIDVLSSANKTLGSLVSSDGFYLRLQAVCSNTRHFTAVFASFANSSKEGCESPHQFLCSNNRCISYTLKCDGYDHCGDNTDELFCATTTMTTVETCSTHFPCRTGKGLYCAEERCDGSWDCSDGSDEHNCWMTDSPTSAPSHTGFLHYHNWGTYIPIGLVAILLVIIACVVISCCARRKHTRRRRQQRALANRMGIASSVLPGQRMRSASETHLNINVDIVRYPDSPPTYEEALRSYPAEGIQNLSYSRTDSMDTFVPLPPPYTPSADDPLPIIYQLTSSQSTPDVRSAPNPALAGIHLGPSVRNVSSGGRGRSPNPSSRTPTIEQPSNTNRSEGRRTRYRHRRRRSRGAGQEDQSALISNAQDTAINSSLEDNSTTPEDNTQLDTNAQGATIIHSEGTSANESRAERSICDNSTTLTDNALVDSGERGEFIELGDTLTLASGVEPDPDSVTLQSGTSGSFCSGADSASGCSTLDQSSTTSSLHKGKTHRRSVSGVSCISKTSVEPSVSKVDEEPCECKSCSCTSECKPDGNCGSEGSECTGKRLKCDAETLDECDAEKFETLQIADTQS